MRHRDGQCRSEREGIRFVNVTKMGALKIKGGGEAAAIRCAALGEDYLTLRLISFI